MDARSDTWGGRLEAMRSGLRGSGGAGGVMLALLLLGPLAVTLTLTAVPGFDVVFESPRFHVVVVTAIACCALVVAILTAVAATRAGSSAPVLLAMGCLAVGILMFAHGLTTPGIWGRPINMWVARLPVLALAVFALCLGAAAAPDHSPLRRTFRRVPRLSLATTSVVLVTFALLLVLRPTALAGALPLPGETIASHLMLAACAVAFFLTGTMHWGRWRLGRDRVQLGLAAASWLSLNAALAFSIGQLWRISWWDYHLFLLAGFASAAWCVFTEARRARSAADALATVSISDPMEHITRGYPEALHALVGAVEAKDRYMLGHSSRVADIAVRIGMRVELDPDALRGLAQGAHLHDIGKIGVPDHVLNKGGSLSPEDWAWIERHPVIGAEMAARAPSLREALTIIRHHHERWDGSGYPDHLEGGEIPLAARIASVADVWDALTSDRAYRVAWAPDRALAHIAQGAGRLFDPTVVEAFLDLVAEQGLWPERARLELEALASAAEACHPRGHGESSNGSMIVASSNGAPGRRAS